jgi:hypothetical protein
MKRILIVMIGMSILAITSGSALAQESDEFVNVLRSNLTEQTNGSANAIKAPSEIDVDREPKLGESVTFESVTLAPITDASSEPYVAGRDTLSGPLAAGAVLLALVIIVLIFFIATSHKGSDKKS